MPLSDGVWTPGVCQLQCQALLAHPVSPPPLNLRATHTQPHFKVEKTEFREEICARSLSWPQQAELGYKVHMLNCFSATQPLPHLIPSS